MKTLSYRRLIEDVPVMVMSSTDDYVAEHKHTFFEFVYVVSGKALHCFEKKTVTISKGDYFLINLNSSHAYKKAEECSDFHIINCLFLPEFIDESLKGARSFQEIIENYMIKYGQSNLAEQPTQRIFHDESGFIGTLTESILEEFQERQVGYADIIRNLLLTLILYLVRSATPDGTPADRSPVRQIKEYIHKNYMESLRLSDICRQMNFSLSYISMLFREEAGMTFRDYLLKVRMEKASLLLRVSDKKVSDIARLVGYSDPAFFYKCFRRAMGQTPDEYRCRFLSETSS